MCWSCRRRTCRSSPSRSFPVLPVPVGPCHYEARVEVSLYGSSGSDVLAKKVLSAVMAFTFEKDSDENNKAANEAINQFVTRVRVDLGVPK